MSSYLITASTVEKEVGCVHGLIRDKISQARIISDA